MPFSRIDEMFQNMSPGPPRIVTKTDWQMDRPNVRYPARSYYCAKDDEIVIDSGDYLNANGCFDQEANERYYEALLHEMTHATGHITRLNRCLNGQCVNYGEKEEAIEELTAEWGAELLCDHFRIPKTPNRQVVIQQFINELKKHPDLNKAIGAARTQAQEAVDFLL